MHNNGALKYYKMNITFLALFFGFTFYNFKMNAQVFFGKEWFAKGYLGFLMYSIFGLWVFSHKHIKSISLLKGGKEVSIETYSNFGLTYSRPKILPVSCLEGNRLFLTK
jgi:TMEM70/TMEM186/TMEM223 protein family